ncbi:peptidase M76 family-domain-containing protein [Hysterangium stoloniferum]|nr:peptidase M76 family-domain-containing protein [Hysterangium stoloniferum]
MSSDASPTPPEDRQFERWRKNLSWITGIGLTPAESESREKDLQVKLERSLLRKCQKTKDDLMQTSPAIVFMLRHLRLSGCPLSLDHVQCISCGTRRAGGMFSQTTGGVLLCTTGYYNRKNMEDSIVHELIHMYDHCKFKVDWSNLRHHACSEIRAASLGGDCRWGREINRFFFTFSKQHQSCVRRRAIISVAANPSCPNQAMAEQAVNEVWESCFRDTRPFDEVQQI